MVDLHRKEEKKKSAREHSLSLDIIGLTYNEGGTERETDSERKRGGFVGIKKSIQRSLS